jgi:ribonuclease HI
MTPAEPLLNYRQSRYAQRLLSRPDESNGAEEILTKQGSALAERLRTVSHLAEGDVVEKSFVVDEMVFPGRIMPDRTEKEALARAVGWKESECTAWTDGSRLDDGRVGCSVVWAVEEVTEVVEEGWEERTSRSSHWDGQAFHLGNNKEVFDAELYAILQAVIRFGKRREYNKEYTIFADAQAALQRCENDADGPGQALARAIIGWSNSILARDNTITLRWVPGHKGVMGNEVADEYAKRGAHDSAAGTRFSKKHQKVASKAFLKRSAADIKRAHTKEWIKSRTSQRRVYILPKKTGFRVQLRNVKKEVASRYYQFLTGHALTAPYLKEKLKKQDSDECWWCESGKRQTREHLFKECSHWVSEIRDLWRAVRKEVGWRRARWKPIAALFREEKATEAVLEFLRNTSVGKVRRVEVPVDGDGMEDGIEE